MNDSQPTETSEPQLNDAVSEFAKKIHDNAFAEGHAIGRQVGYQEGLAAAILALSKLQSDPPFQVERVASLEDRIGVLHLSTRTTFILRRDGIETIGELTSKTDQDLMDLRGFGKVSMDEVESKLAKVGHSLR